VISVPFAIRISAKTLTIVSLIKKTSQVNQQRVSSIVCPYPQKKLQSSKIHCKMSNKPRRYTEKVNKNISDFKISALMCETLIIDLIGFSLTFAMHARIGSLQLLHLPFDKSEAQCFSPYKQWDFLHIYTPRNEPGIRPLFKGFTKSACNSVI